MEEGIIRSLAAHAGCDCPECSANRTIALKAALALLDQEREKMKELEIQLTRLNAAKAGTCDECVKHDMVHGKQGERVTELEAENTRLKLRTDTEDEMLRDTCKRLNSYFVESGIELEDLI
jgi:hypothetical protein